MYRLFFALFTTMMLSEEELRFTLVFKQGRDTSCGVAVTASLLNTYWNIPMTESDLYQNFFFDQVQDGTVSYMVSFLNIANCLRSQGIHSQAYKMDWDALEDSLAKGYAPVLIHYEKPYPHFALVVHIESNYAFVADPARGFSLVDKREFIKNYSGNALLTASRTLSKETKLLEQAISGGRERLARLQNLARRRRF
jgi:predicted double-glycine peptidase